MTVVLEQAGDPTPRGAAAASLPSPASSSAARETLARLMEEHRDYYRLCDEAAQLGIPVGLDDTRAPHTVAGLRTAVETRRAQIGPALIAEPGRTTPQRVRGRAQTKGA